VQSTDLKSDIAAVERLHAAHAEIKKEIGKAIVGQEKVIEQLLISLFSSGHCLLVGVPGLAKTLLISTLSQVLSLEFKRIQFTPDLMPSDITGTEIIEEDHSTGKRQFRFVKGPVFANIILADEINRTPPKTQAALLQAMQEHEVTAAGDTYKLDEPFFVLATQNPIEQEGTYPLPEAQLDRFMFNVIVDYPDMHEEREIVKSTTTTLSYELAKVLSAEQIVGFQQLVRRVPVSDHLIEYAVKLVRTTRPTEPNAPDFVKNWVNWGAGPRASQYLILAAKTKAILDGRPTPGPDDIRFAAYPVLRHRIVTSFNAEADGVDSLEVIKRCLEIVKAPEGA
jgi:MoxR-like ATPase